MAVAEIERHVHGRTPTTRHDDGHDMPHDGGCGHAESSGHDHGQGGCGHDHHDGCGCGHHHGGMREHGHDTRCAHHGHDEACACGHDHGTCACEHGGGEGDAPPSLAGAPTFVWAVVGLDCPSCASEVQHAVSDLACVSEARLTYATSTLEVIAGAGAAHTTVRRAVLDLVRSMGYDLELSASEVEELDAAPDWWHRHREAVLMGASGMALACGLVAEHALGSERAATPLYVAAAVLGLVFIAPMAISSLRRRTADMNVLMGIAVIGSLLLGLAGDTTTFADAAVVIFLDQVGEWLEGWSMRKASGSIRGLMELAPDVAHVIDDGGTTTDVAVGQVGVGDTVRVRAGERVPLDGTIVAGSSAFNESAITGESVPADKGMGATVFAGSLNTTGVVDVSVTAPAASSTLARVVEQVQGAQARKAPYESFVDRFAAVYTPVVVASAAVVGLVVPAALSLATGATAALWHDWAYRALSLLVVACPCALVISTPVSFVSAITRAARDGVLVKGGGIFDIAAHVSAVALDKTGTLTEGVPAVTGITPLAGADESDVLGIAAALESDSAHPLARAIIAEADRRALGIGSATGVTETVAAGASGVVGGVTCAIGKPAFAATFALPDDAVGPAVADVAATGATALVVVRGDVAIGVVGVSDMVRTEAADAIARLHGLGVSTIMLTGDHAVSAAAVAGSLGVTSFAADLLPEGKVSEVRALQEAGVVAMVGDGVNDAPALATADLGVTMGAASSDTALEVADVALLADDLAALPGLLVLGRRTMRVVRENIAFAIAVKVLVFVAVIAGVAGMGAAVFADTGVALIVILNGMRLMLRRR